MTLDIILLNSGDLEPEPLSSTPRMPNIKVFSGSSHPDLAKKTVERLGNDNILFCVSILIDFRNRDRSWESCFEKIQ